MRHATAGRDPVKGAISGLDRVAGCGSVRRTERRTTRHGQAYCQGDEPLVRPPTADRHHRSRPFCCSWCVVFSRVRSPRRTARLRASAVMGSEAPAAWRRRVSPQGGDRERADTTILSAILVSRGTLLTSSYSHASPLSLPGTGHVHLTKNGVIRVRAIAFGFPLRAAGSGCRFDKCASRQSERHLR
jgi:hypothetical protein